MFIQIDQLFKDSNSIIDTEVKDVFRYLRERYADTLNTCCQLKFQTKGKGNVDIGFSRSTSMNDEIKSVLLKKI